MDAAPAIPPLVFQLLDHIEGEDEFIKGLTICPVEINIQMASLK